MGALEKQIVNRTRELMKSAGAKTIKTSGAGEPDVVGCYRGFSFAIECKQPGKKPTPLQYARMREWRRAGGIAFATDFPADAFVTLQDEVEKRIRAIVREFGKDEDEA